jgi:hypothetical protein
LSDSQWSNWCGRDCSVAESERKKSSSRKKSVDGEEKESQGLRTLHDELQANHTPDKGGGRCSRNQTASFVGQITIKSLLSPRELNDRAIKQLRKIITAHPPRS